MIKILKLSWIILFFALASNGWAFEIITEEDIQKKVIVSRDLIKTTDNAIFLFDASSSMKKQYKETGMSRYEVAKKVLMDRNRYLPNLGYNFGFYLYTPWQAVYPIQRYNREKFAAALKSLPEEPTGATDTVQALRRLETVLKQVHGRVSVFLFTDGSDVNKGGGRTKPSEIADKLAKTYDVCFYIISTNDDYYSSDLFDRAQGFNGCSRVLGFDQFIEHPEFNSEALFTVIAKKNIVTVIDEKIIGIVPRNVLFDIDRVSLPQAFVPELNKVGNFLNNNPNAYVVLAGHSDSSGSKEHNLAISKARAKHLAFYLSVEHGISRDRIKTFWYGEINPLADNATKEGRAANRRVEIVIGIK